MLMPDTGAAFVDYMVSGTHLMKILEPILTRVTDVSVRLAIVVVLEPIVLRGHADVVVPLLPHLVNFMQVCCCFSTSWCTVALRLDGYASSSRRLPPSATHRPLACLTCLQNDSVVGTRVARLMIAFSDCGGRVVMYDILHSNGVFGTLSPLLQILIFCDLAHRM
jgi:hypothetical protein